MTSDVWLEKVIISVEVVFIETSWFLHLFCVYNGKFYKCVLIEMLCYWLYHIQHIKDIDSMLLLYCRYVRKIILSNLLLFTLSDACFSLPYKEGLIIKCYCQVGNQEIRYALQNFVEKTVYFHVDSLSLDQTRPLAFR